VTWVAGRVLSRTSCLVVLRMTDDDATDKVEDDDNEDDDDETSPSADCLATLVTLATLVDLGPPPRLSSLSALALMFDLSIIEKQNA